MMGNREKEKGIQHQTHVSYYKHVRESNASVAVIENVPEYEEALVKKELGKGWDSRLSPVGSPLLWAGLRKGTGLHRLLAHQQSEVGVSLYLEVLCGTFTLTGGHESW